MKKFVLTCCLLSVVCCVGASSGDPFISALRNCSTYSESGTINVNGVETNTEKQMLGWQGDKCVYKETLNYSGRDIATVCKFSRAQINEIVSASDAYFSQLKQSGQQFDVSSFESIQNNPVAKILSRYLQDSSVCTMSGLE